MKLIVLIVLSLLACSSFAGSVQSKKIHMLFSALEKPTDPKGPEAVFIYFEGNATDPAKCSKNPNRFSINPKTEGGKAHLQIAMLAYQMNKSVVVAGSGKCSVWGDTEDLRYLHIVP